jgi:hypothetical protein
MENINWICKSDTINNTIVWSCRPKDKEHFDSIETFESSSDKMIGVKVSLKNVLTGGILADGTEGTIIKVATDSQPYLVARIDTPDVIWWYKQDELKFPSSETLLCLSQLVNPDQNPNSPGCLMTMNGTDWFVPNIAGKVWGTYNNNNQVRIGGKLNNKYYACMWGPQMLYSSTDLKNWEPVVAPNDIFKNVGGMGVITFKNKLYVAVYDRGFYSTSDGNTWKKHGKNYDDKEYIDASSLMEMKIINDKLYFVYRYQINQFDETTNTSKAISPMFHGGGNNTINHLGYDSNTKTYLAICYSAPNGDSQASLFYWSNDLVNWNRSTGKWSTGKYSSFNNLTNAFGKWWARGVDSSLLVCSEDGGKTWNEVKSPVNSEGLLFFFNNTLTYWGRDDPANMFFSTTDGKNWQKVVKPNLLMKGGFLGHISIM